MPLVRFTRHLKRYFPSLAEGEVGGSTVAEVIAALEQRHPGIADFLVDERGALRKHVNVFIGSEMIVDRTTLSDRVAADAELFIMQALSGG